jgi:hypothetical protein
VALAPLARDGQGEASHVIRIGKAAWRVARPQQMVIRRNTIATARAGQATRSEIPTAKLQDPSTTSPR